jgi:predicted alpha/beta-hydrolase family hydrolase
MNKNIPAVLMRAICLFALLTISVTAQAGELLRITTREGIRTTLAWHETPNARITVLVLSGGEGGFGRVENGLPTSGNFLIRTAQHWIDQGFNYAAFGKPSDMDELERNSDAHLVDLKATVKFLKSKTNTPIYVIGTSRGTISATRMLIDDPESNIAGGVLTASVLGYKNEGAVRKQDLSKIKVPVLVYHHSRDACVHCMPHEASNVIRGLKNAPVKKLMMVDGGSNPQGNPCHGQHWHGFIGMEREAVGHIADWIRKPTN